MKHTMPTLPAAHRAANPGTLVSPLAGLLTARVGALVALYTEVMATRMQGVPVLNPAVKVQALGFELTAAPQAQDTTEQGHVESAIGILITPWFMSLIWLPLRRLEQPAQVGCSQAHYVGTTCLDFIASHDGQLGSYAACSLFSPMFEFEDHAAALATAQAVLDKLREEPPPQPESSGATPKAPARRNFLLARSNQAARGSHG